jgi:hypothetical protein
LKEHLTMHPRNEKLPETTSYTTVAATAEEASLSVALEKPGMAEWCWSLYTHHAQFD